MINDWEDNNQVDKIYAIPCYTQAIQLLSSYPDIAGYSSAIDDIHRAMLAVIQDRRIGRSRSGDAVSGCNDSRASLAAVDTKVTESDAIRSEGQNRAASGGILAFESGAVTPCSSQPKPCTNRDLCCGIDHARARRHDYGHVSDTCLSHIQRVLEGCRVVGCSVTVHGRGEDRGQLVGPGHGSFRPAH